MFKALQVRPKGGRVCEPLVSAVAHLLCSECHLLPFFFFSYSLHPLTYLPDLSVSIYCAQVSPIWKTINHSSTMHVSHLPSTKATSLECPLLHLLFTPQLTLTWLLLTTNLLSYSNQILHSNFTVNPTGPSQSLTSCRFRYCCPPLLLKSLCSLASVAPLLPDRLLSVFPPHVLHPLPVLCLPLGC